MSNWMFSGIKSTIIAVAGLATFGLADNPISSYHYLADPSAASDDDTFYILTDVDDYSPQKNYDYKIVGLYAFTSKDMKNWTDHGMIFRSKREFTDYPSNTWASGIAVKKNGRVFIVYPNGASGVGMITAPSIDGPYTDPIKKAYGVNYIAAHYDASFLNGCDQIAHCFDPGIFIEDDGTGYVIFGGGENGDRGYGNNLDIIKFTESNGNVTLDKNSLKRLDAPGSFEAPYIHKYKGHYYLSFNTQPQVIDYSVSRGDDIMGPYDFVGTVIPSIGNILQEDNIYKEPGKTNLPGGNNHQGFAEFKGKWYAVYHDRRLVSRSNHPRSCTEAGECADNPNSENHRSVSIDELTWSYDQGKGYYTMNRLQFTDEGPEQIDYFDPYDRYKALTSSKQLNVRSRTDWTKNQPVTHVLTPLASKESWIRVSGVDFGKGAKKFSITGASVAEGNKVEIRTGSASGTLAGTCDIKKTSGWQDYADNECEVSGLAGIIEQLFIVFKGSKDSTMGLIEWEFIGEGGRTPDTPQSPYGGTAWAIPGKIEAENFDVPGVGRGSDLKSYYDSDSEDHGAESNGGVSFREGTGVDIYKKATGYIVGYNAEGEWLEYTVNVTEAGDYTVFASVATDNETSGFTLSLDGEPLASFATKGTSFDIFDTIQTNVTIPSAGQHILKMAVTGAWFDVDFFAFVKGKDAKSEDIVEALPKTIKLGSNSHATYDVFNLKGKKIASFTARNMDEAKALWNNGAVKGSEKACGMCLIRNRSNGMTAKIRVFR